MFGFPFRKKEENMCPQDEAYAIYRKPAPPSCSIQTFLPQLKYWLINPCRATKLSQSYRVQGLLIHDLLTKISGVSWRCTTLWSGGLRGPSCRRAVSCAPGFGCSSSLGSCFCAEKCFSQTSAAIMWLALANDGG